MAATVQLFDPPSSASSESDEGEIESVEPVFLPDEAEDEEERSCDYYAVPNTPPPQSPRPPSTGSQKSPRSKRQRTASVSQSSKKTSSESIIRSHKRTIYTAGRPPWYNYAGQQVEPFVIESDYAVEQLSATCDVMPRHLKMVAVTL